MLIIYLICSDVCIYVCMVEVELLVNVRISTTTIRIYYPKELLLSSGLMTLRWPFSLLVKLIDVILGRGYRLRSGRAHLPVTLLTPVTCFGLQIHKSEINEDDV